MTDSAKAIIHVVEDEAGVARMIETTLARFDYRARVFRTGGDFLRHLRNETPDLCVLDLGLPDIDGIEIVQRVRTNHRFGLLILTGRCDTHDRVVGLELGSDDYMVKPFEPRELIARVRSILRRYRPDEFGTGECVTRVAQFAGWIFECATNRLIAPNGDAHDLGLAEAQLLRAFLQRPNQILSREQLLDGRSVEALDRSIDLRVSRLRKRLSDDPQHARLIKTVYGGGYLFRADVEWSR